MARFKSRTNKPSGFNYGDLLIATETEGNEDWSQIIANERGRTAINEIISYPIDWGFGGAESVATRIGAPQDWRIIEVSLVRYEHAGHATRVPQVDAEPRALRTSLRWAVGALRSGSDPSVVIYDELTGFQLVKIEDDRPVTIVIDFDNWRGVH